MQERLGGNQEPAIAIQLLRTDSGPRIKMDPTEEAMQTLQGMADQRGTSVEGMIAEAFRLEQLLADGKLYTREQHKNRLRLRKLKDV